MRKRQFKTQTDVDRAFKNGYGQGELESYKPWIRAQDIGSKGESHKIRSNKTNRVHHCLSKLEAAYLLVLDFSEDVVDIREQFPLFASQNTFDLAAELGIAYPYFPQTTVPYVMTTDFLVTVRGPGGETRFAARTLKYASDLSDEKNLRLLEKFELERAIWQSRGVDDWKIVTEKTIGKNLTNNMIWLRRGADETNAPAMAGLADAFLAGLERFRHPDRKLDSTIRTVTKMLDLDYSAGILLFKRLMWEKKIRIDLHGHKLSSACLCPDMVIDLPKMAA